LTYLRPLVKTIRWTWWFIWFIRWYSWSPRSIC